MRFRAALALGAWLTASAGLAQAQTATDLRGGGQYEAVNIAGFVLPIKEVEQLGRAGILRLNPDSGRFGFAKGITSETRLRKAVQAAGLTRSPALRDLYRANKVALPNAAAHTLTIPSGFGPGTFSNQRSPIALGVGIGGVSRVPYTSSPDGGLGFSLSFGNAFETVGATLSMSFNDLSEIGRKDRISFGFKLSRYVSDGLSVAIGGENLLVQTTDGESSFYAVASLAFDKDKGIMPFDGVVTLGVGTGRFAHKTPRDVAAGKGRDATSVFGAIAVELSPRFNLVADWNGRNLSAGFAWNIPRTGVSMRLGVRDLTDNSGDGPRLTGSLGFTLARF